ncbi:hypothetical protein ACR71G_04730 [Xenorhabdus bovienii]|uniref:Uncharacterized protein n=1 Tax=Xenorhabdus bovienii str. kraussei Becker Underwood TaxID=1398204 RepID=A0A077PRW1_XENBV|nr:hypothetical protein [Xenorhabdus bovienii]CDH22594.1 conserved hypothetical protein [Xenorhabdus bovienii str. kraussei Becker Underwood]
MSHQNKDVLTATISNKANLIIGQDFSLTVTLKTKNLIKIQSVNIIFTGATKNISVPTGNLSLNLDGSTGYIATYTTVLTVSNHPNVIKENDPIKFTIKVNGSDADPFVFTGTARTINPDSLSLMLNEVFLDTPNIEGSKPLTGKGAMVTTLLLDKAGNSLGNTPIFISSKVPEHLSACKILKYDNITPILPESIWSFSGLSINSDNEGNIKFYIHPQESDSMVLELESWIVGVGNPVSANSPLFIVNTETPDILDTIPEPNILGGFPGPLTSDSGEPNFYVGVYYYPKAETGDYILFFTKSLDKQGTKREYSGHYVIVGNPKTELGLEKYSYSLPYDIFKVGVTYDFNYIVILGKSAGSITSMPTSVTYMGGAIYNPPTNVTRDYDLCKVYTSLGIGKAEIQPDTGISYDSIKRYLDNPSTPNTGLFVEVLGGNNIAGKVPLNSKVTLNVYIQSSNCNTHKSWTLPMPIKVDSQGIASLPFHIPFEFLNKIYPYDNGGPGSIYFDYEFNIGNKKHYGKIWEGLIDTRSE